MNRFANEIWVPVLGWEASHMVSSHGRIKSLRTGRLLRASSTGAKYSMVVLWVNARKPNERKQTRRVHRIVLESFSGKIPKGLCATHINGNALDNRIENLRWGTYQENALDKRRHGTSAGRKNIKRDKLTERDVRQIVSKLRAGVPISKLAKQFGVGESNISHIKCGYTWKHLSTHPKSGDKED